MECGSVEDRCFYSPQDLSNCHCHCVQTRWTCSSESHSEGTAAGPSSAARHCPKARDRRAGAKCVETKFIAT
ncbi:hypothetical protein CesoFtcFv8_001442 [Champsocephalus esox]|uniref:Uncharacterized protein n=1 Tax=Champsocephalus esox TaxID=159716 RepID=A0AAN8HHH2_9TELE|nr:hypothetical protein CesoFtcFv8_001442 [Champsocephalus esox]